MRDGLYKVEISGFGATSNGVVVLDGVSLLGGDSSHYFHGSMHQSDGRVRLDMRAERHSAHPSPAFGPLARAHLLLKGLDGDGCITLVGAAEEIRALAIKVRLSPLLLQDEVSERTAISGA